MLEFHPLNIPNHQTLANSTGFVYENNVKIHQENKLDTICLKARHRSFGTINIKRLRHKFRNFSFFFFGKQKSLKHDDAVCYVRPVSHFRLVN